MYALENSSTSCIPGHLNMNYNHIAQHYISYVIICVTNSLTAAMAIFINVLVILAILKTPVIHTPPNTLLGCLAVTDFLTGFIAQPAFIANKVFLMQQNFENFCWAILATSASSYILTGTSFLVLTSIAVDKFIAMKLHLRYNELVTCKRALLTVFILFIFTCCLTSMLYINRPVFNVIAIGNILANFILQWFAYFKVFRTVNQHRKRIKTETSIPNSCGRIDTVYFHKISRSSSTMIYIVILSVLCYVPFVVVRVTESLFDSVDKNLQFAEKIAMTIVYSNSVLNPLLYCYRITSLRRAIFKVLKLEYNRNKVNSIAPSGFHFQ